MFETETSHSYREILLMAFENKYETLEQLDQKVKISRCADPTMVDDLMVWKALTSNNASLKETVYYEDVELLGALTPLRVELLEMLRKERAPISVTNISKKMRRDYKNVYDDLKILVAGGLVDRVKKGREVLMSSRIRKITVAFEDGDIYY